MRKCERLVVILIQVVFLSTTRTSMALVSDASLAFGSFRNARNLEPKACCWTITKNTRRPSLVPCDLLSHCAAREFDGTPRESRDTDDDTNRNNTVSSWQRRTVAVQQELEVLDRLMIKEPLELRRQVSETETVDYNNGHLRHRRRIAKETLDSLTRIRSESGTASEAPDVEEATSGVPGENTRVDHHWNRDGVALSSSVVTVPMNPLRNRSSTQSPSTLLRMVVISDTHGFEHQLFHKEIELVTAKMKRSNATEVGMLPDADVLIHCGDFCASGARTTKLQARDRLDEWLATQTHIPTKLVVRGNHDPHHSRSNLFPKSLATYISKPTTLQVATRSEKQQKRVTLCVRPYSRRKEVVLLPPECDIVISHEPPFGILDRTYTNQHAGSKSLRRAVEQSRTKPKLWLCGHIHEGRGSYLHSFIPNKEKGRNGSLNLEPTLVMNAANANSGRANRVVAGPVLVDMVDTWSDGAMANAWNTSCTMVRARADAAVPLIHPMRRDSLEAMRMRSLSPLVDGDIAQSSSTFRETPDRLLLAVDLGLRTSTAVLDEQGNLLRLCRWRITDKGTLDAALQEMLVNVTHVVVESSDPKLYRIWKRAIGEHAPTTQVARVLTNDWRDYFLTPKEIEQKQNVKGVSIGIARQFWNSSRNRSAPGSNDKRLVKEGAQAILVGYYAINMLGWIDPEEPMLPKRYSNGDLVKQ